MKKGISLYIRSYLQNIVTTLVLLAYLFPVLWLLGTSLKPRIDIIANPPVWFFKPTFENYINVFLSKENLFLLFFKNSIVITIITLAVSLIVGAIAAYGLARNRFMGQNFIAFCILAFRMLPPVALIVPMFLIMDQLNLVDTWLGLIIPFTALNIPLTIWMLRAFVQEIPTELDDAAMMDGCSHLGAFIRVIFPLMAPGLVATSIFAFTLVWNDLTIAITLTTSKAVTLPVALARFRVDEGILWGEVSAMTMVVVIPVMIFTMLVQKHLVRGLTTGSIK